MIRRSVLIAGAIAATCAAFVTGASVPTKTANPPAEANADAPKTVVAVGQKTGYFNMAKVMRECKRARTAVERLNARKDRMAANLTGLRNMHADLQMIAQRSTDRDKKEEAAEGLIAIARQIEDTSRALNKTLNDRATIIIVELYDEIRAVTTEVAHDNGLVALLAFPDAVTQADAENPLIKEAKLKPPALQPFFLDPSVEYSDEIVRRLNDKFAIENGE